MIAQRAASAIGINSDKSHNLNLNPNLNPQQVIAQRAASAIGISSDKSHNATHKAARMAGTCVTNPAALNQRERERERERERDAERDRPMFSGSLKPRGALKPKPKA